MFPYLKSSLICMKENLTPFQKGVKLPIQDNSFNQDFFDIVFNFYGDHTYSLTF